MPPCHMHRRKFVELTMTEKMKAAVIYEAGGPEEFMATPLQDLITPIEAGALQAQVGEIFTLDNIVEAHRCMESNAAGGKIVVLT